MSSPLQQRVLTENMGTGPPIAEAPTFLRQAHRVRYRQADRSGQDHSPLPSPDQVVFFNTTALPDQQGYVLGQEVGTPLHVRLIMKFSTPPLQGSQQEQAGSMSCLLKIAWI